MYESLSWFPFCVCEFYIGNTTLCIPHWKHVTAKYFMIKYVTLKLITEKSSQSMGILMSNQQLHKLVYSAFAFEH